MYSTTALRALARAGQARVSISWPLTGEKNDSARALSWRWPVRPADRVTRQSLAWAAWAAEVYWQPRSELNRIRFNSDYAEVDVKPENLRMAC
jgi:hypothetical protein